MRIIDELRRRRVFRVAGLYLVAAWAVLQVADVTLEPLGFAPGSMTILTVIAIVGFPVSLVLGWFFDFTKNGIVRTLPAGREALSAEELKLTKFDYGLLAASIVVVAVIGVGAADRLSERAVVYNETFSVSAPPRSIAVLPFVSFSSYSDAQFFGDGIAEEILNRLARIAALKVTARTSSFRFRGQNSDIREIAARLGVETILEGSIRVAGDQVRVTAQLIDADSGYHLWSDNFDRAFDAIFDVQDDIATAIADALEIELVGHRVAGRRPTSNMQAYEEYLRGRYFVQFQDDESLDKAAEHFRNAIDLDNNFAEAHAGLAEARLVHFMATWTYGDFTSDRSDEKQDAERETMPALIRALTLNPDLPDAHAALGFFEWFFNEDLEKGTEGQRTAIGLSPGYAPAHKYLGVMTLQSAHDPENAKISLERAAALDPLDFSTNWWLSHAYVRLNHMGDAREQWALLYELDPNHWPLLDSIGGDHLYMGDIGDAVPYVRRAFEIAPDEMTLKFRMFHLHFSLDDVDVARPYLDQMIQDDPDNYMTFYAQVIYLFTIKDWTNLETVLSDKLAQIDRNAYEVIFANSVLRYAALYYTIVEEYDEARSHWEAVQDGPFLDPLDEVRYFSELAAFYRLSGDESQKEIAHQKTLDLLEEHAPVVTEHLWWPYTAATLALLDDDVDAAIGHLRELLRGNPYFPRAQIEIEPAHRGMHDDPRFFEILREAEQFIAKRRAEIYAEHGPPD